MNSTSRVTFLWAISLKVALLLILVAVSATYPAVPGLTASREANTPTLVWYLSRGLDCNAYQRMATEGWYDDFTVGLPLGYPLAIRSILPLTRSAPTAALLITNICSIAALLVFQAIAARYAGTSPGRARLATMLFATFPGILTFGTVAYSEGMWVLVTLCCWWAYLRSGDRRASGDSCAFGNDAPRDMRWLLLSSVLAALSVQVRHAGVALVAGLVLVEGIRVLLATTSRMRALAEAAIVFVVAALPTAAYFVFKFFHQDMGRAERELFDTRLVPFGGLHSLISSGTAPEYIVLIYLSLPFAIVLLIHLFRLDIRLALVVSVQLFLALSVTGIAAQSLNRLEWAIAPLALGALLVKDRLMLVGMCAFLFLLSTWCGIAHVLGTAAL